MNLFKLKKVVDKTNKKFYSQFKEDLYLLEIFKNKDRPVCLDVGANDGCFGSNSALLELNGWLCVLIEPNPALCKKILETRKPFKLFDCAASSKDSEVLLYLVKGGELAHGLSTLEPNKENINRIESNNFSYDQIIVKSKTLDNLIKEACVSKVDLVSIDVEGHELEALKGLNIEKWRPKIFIIEDNSMYKSKVISKYMSDFGYKLFFRTGVNDWYGHESDVELINFSNITFYKFNKILQLLKFKLSKLPYLRELVRLIRLKS